MAFNKDEIAAILAVLTQLENAPGSGVVFGVRLVGECDFGEIYFDPEAVAWVFEPKENSND